MSADNKMADDNLIVIYGMYIIPYGEESNFFLYIFSEYLLISY